jgi:hypothetical protein
MQLARRASAANSLVKDPERGWVGAADWATQDRLRSYPADRPALTPVVR